MSTQSIIPKVSIQPEEDARLPILEAEIERRWRQYRPAFVRLLTKQGKLGESIRKTAVWCIETMNSAQIRGLNPDQARELIQPLIDPELET